MKKDNTKYCKSCNKNVTTVKKMFGVLLCPTCNIIIGGPYSIEGCSH